MTWDLAGQALNEAQFRELARRGLAPEPSPAIFDPRTGRAYGPGDWDLNPELKGELAAMAPPRPAAVLVPIVLREELTVLLDAALPRHAEPPRPDLLSRRQDWRPVMPTPVAGALREAHEEIGLPPDTSSPWVSSTAIAPAPAFRSARWSAFVRPGFSRARSARGARSVRGAARLPDGPGQSPEGLARVARAAASFYAMPYEGRYIWGATAGILKNIHQRLFQR